MLRKKTLEFLVDWVWAAPPPCRQLCRPALSLRTQAWLLPRPQEGDEGSLSSLPPPSFYSWGCSQRRVSYSPNSFPKGHQRERTGGEKVLGRYTPEFLGGYLFLHVLSPFKIFFPVWYIEWINDRFYDITLYSVSCQNHKGKDMKKNVCTCITGSLCCIGRN